MPFEVENLPEAIRDTKNKLRRELPASATVFREVESEMRSTDTSLLDRVAQLPSSCRVRYGVVSASDDFLNTPEIWDGAPASTFIILPHGGHTGFFPDRWFGDFRHKLYLSDEKSGTPTN